MAEMERVRVLIADFEGQVSRHTASYLNERGFDCRVVHNGTQAKREILEFRPRFVLADLMLPDINALGLLDFIKNERSLRHNFIKLIVMSGHNHEQNVKQAFAHGAHDFIVKPFNNDDLVNRLIFHCRKTRHIKEITQNDVSSIDEASLMLHLTDLVLRQGISDSSPQTKLYNLTRMVAKKMDGVRCNIVQVSTPSVGLVVTSSDNPKASGIKLDLGKYPEITSVHTSGRMLAIEDIAKSKSLKTITANFKNISFSSMIVCPVDRFSMPFGVLSLRMPKSKKKITDNEIRFVEIVSHIITMILSNENFSENRDFWRKAS